MGELNSLVNDGPDRRRIIMKQFPERKSENGSLDRGERAERVAGGDWLEAAVELVSRIEHTPQHFPPEARRPLGGHFAVLTLHFAEAPVVGDLCVMARCLRFVKRLDDEAARAAQDVVRHAITMPPSTWMHWPVM